MSSALGELLESLPTAIEQRYRDAQRRIGNADAERDAVRDEVRALKGDTSASQKGGAESDESAAYEKLTASTDTFLEALTAFDSAVQNKVALIQAHETELRERVVSLGMPAAPEPKLEPKPKPNPLSKLTKSGLEKMAETVGEFISTPLMSLKSFDPDNQRHVSQLATAIVGAPTYGVGRAVTFAALQVQILDKVYGFKAANDLIEYMFDNVAKALRPYTFTVGGKKRTFPSWLMTDGPRNDKEWGLADQFPALCLEQFSRNKDRPGNKERIKLCLEILDGSADYWNTSQYRDDLYGPCDRIIHPRIAFTRRHIVLSRYHPDAERRAISQKKADEFIPYLVDEFAYIPSPVGEAIVHGCVVEGGTDPKAIKGDTDYYQPNCYVGHNALLLYALGIDGIAPFNTSRFHEAYANTIRLLSWGGPFEWHSRDDEKGTSTSYGSKGTSTLLNQISPPAFKDIPETRWFDARKSRPGDLRVKTIGGSTKKLRTADFGEHWRDLRSMAYFGGGLALVHGSDEYVAESVDYFLGDNLSKFRGETRLTGASYLSGLTLRERGQF